MSTTADVPADLASFCSRFLAAWSEHDLGAVADGVTDDVVVEDPAWPQPIRGVPELQRFMQAVWVTFPDLRVEEPTPPHRTAAGDQVAFRWRMLGTMLGPAGPPGFAPTGRTIDIEGVDLWTMRDGRIARARVFYDMSEILRQLGIAPARGSRGERAMVAVQRLQARMLVKHERRQRVPFGAAVARCVPRHGGP
jgi:steroid delta-isomerase-like uncharacterized protein